MTYSEKNKNSVSYRTVHAYTRDTRIYHLIYIFIILIGSLILMTPARGQEKQDQPVLKQAVMCEELKESAPYNQGIAFSSTLGSIVCFTDFDPVPVKTFIYHKYYQKDSLSRKVKLTLNPPRWATHSRIHPRETDKGPWRVEITDADENIIHIIRFSITD